MEEYVPKTIPIISATDKLLKTSPPKITKERTTNEVKKPGFRQQLS